jgi:hypothetical protein
MANECTRPVGLRMPWPTGVRVGRVARNLEMEVSSMRTFPQLPQYAGGIITWLEAFGYVLLLAAAFVLYTWIFGFVSRRRSVHHEAEIHEVPRAPMIRKVA